VPVSTLTLARQKIHHVFVLVQENHAFDSYFGLYPGTNGQQVENLGTALAKSDDCETDPVAGGCQRPFLISSDTKSPNYVPDAADINGGDNSRYGQEQGIDHGRMDGFLAEDESGTAPLGSSPTAAAIEAHNESLAIEGVYDCNTIPYLWYYAKNFALYDHYFQGDTGPSTPGNIQLFAGQIGQTEAAAGEGTTSSYTGGGSYSDGVPISNDDNPPASNISFIANSYTPDNSTYQSYATMPVMLSPVTDAAAVKAGDVGFISHDLSVMSHYPNASVPWAWYQEGMYSGNNGFVAHHAAPLYFNYINSANSAFATKTTLRDNSSSNGLISDIQSGTLPSEGVFWVKGGVANSYGLKPADPIFTNNSKAKQYYVGDNDHPGSGDADHQVSEAYLAQVINAIAQSKYWKDSMIVITWDDSGGFYDHVPPPEYGKTCPQDLSGPDVGYSCGDGVRLPALVISPYGKTGAVVHNWADHGSVSKLIEAIFGLPNFGQLPNESIGAREGLGPADTNPQTSNLLDALDPAKLAGFAPPNNASLAEIPSPSSPPAMSCATLGITPIRAPAPLPSGYETAGYYLHESLQGSSTAIALPEHDDSDD
jgi:phospholipase C